jgi:prepilin-type N-terminal cleavage/methylation domain-containing protein
MLSLRESQKGVSLAEVLVALFILSLVGAIVVGGVFVATKGNNLSRTNILAEGLARYELEYVKSVAADNWTNISNRTDIYSYTLPSAQGPLWDTTHKSLPVGDEYLGYTIVVTISTMPAYTDKNVRNVNATVIHAGSDNRTIATYIVAP